MIELTILANGRVDLSEDLLDHLGVRPGAELEFEMLQNGRVSLYAARAPSGGKSGEQSSSCEAEDV